MTLVLITEKPDASKRIAEALAENKSLRKHTSDRGVNYYEFERNGKNHMVICAVGHLFNLIPAKKGRGWTYPIFDFEWKPSFEVKKSAEFSKKYFDVVKRMIRMGGEFIVATDYDTEGSVIGYNVLRFLAGVEKAGRMKFSTLTKDELVDSYSNMSKELDFPQVEAGLTRHFLDALWGFNMTRALTIALKNSGRGGFAILSSGRVQSPTLAMLMERELEIRKFKPTPYWQVELRFEIEGSKFVANYEKTKIWEKDAADKVLDDCKDGEAVVSNIKKREYRESPPIPFNTTDLQSESYNQFKLSPTQTLSIAEGLYQAGYISYPRSSSQKLPLSVGYEKILKALANMAQYRKFAEALLKKGKLAPAEGEKNDPAHPSVYATHETPDLKKLSAWQKKIYDLVARRTLAVFAEDAIRESNTVELDINGHKFMLVGKKTLKPGWTEVYFPYTSLEEQRLPGMKIGDRVKAAKLEQLSKQTEPPGRYSQGSILKELENRNLGTKATRAEILQTLYDRKYIMEKSIHVTKLGEAVVNALKENAPSILSEELTRHFEQEMEQIYSGERKKEAILEEAKKTLTEILEEFRSNEKNVGKLLVEALQVSREDERKLGTCLNCKTGQMMVFFSVFTKKRFAGCSNYSKCTDCGFTKDSCECKCGICGGLKSKCKDGWKEKKWTPSCQAGFPLPAVGQITSVNKQCEVCKWPMIQVWRKGRRPFRMCINHECKSKEDWGKNKKKLGKRTRVSDKK